jgi:hypothetical protein
MKPVRLRARGRPPTAYSRERAEHICHELAEGKSLRLVCKELGIAPQTVYGWVIDNHEGFGDQYARARHLMALRWADELDEIASHKNNDYYVDDEGKLKPDLEHIARSRLRIDTRKWMLSKMLPKVYGDKIITEVTGKDGGPVEMQATKIDVLALDPDQRDQLKQILLAATKGKTENETS